MFKGVDAIDFARRFPNNEACLRFLEQKKWKNGYRCVRCGCDYYVKGKTSFHRRCRSCAYDESVTANTLFHDMHLPLMKAFYLLFRIVTKKKGMSTVELAGEVSVQQKTAWLFKRKIQVAMRGLDMEKLSIGEFIMGGNQPIVPKAKQQRPAVSAYNRKNRHKGFRGSNRPAMINPEKDGLKGLGFRGQGVYALLFKFWLRGIHHKCSRALFYAYCDEFWYKQHHRATRAGIFDNSLSNVLLSSPHPYAVLTTTGT